MEVSGEGPLRVDYEKAVEEISSFVRGVVGEREVLLGLSGGLDSSVTAALLVEALGSERVHGLIMPTHFTPKEDIEDAISVAEALGIDYRLVQIDPIVESYAERLGLSQDDHGYRMAFGNLRARVRMTLLYFYANATDGLVAGTGDKSEILIGYFTKYGDGGVDFLPIAHLYKTQVRQLGVRLGLPGRVCSKPPAPRLYPGHVARDEIPVDYDKLDILLYYIFDKGLGPEEASAKAELPVEVATWVCRRYHSTEHKRSMPPSLLKIEHVPPRV